MTFRLRTTALGLGLVWLLALGTLLAGGPGTAAGAEWGGLSLPICPGTPDDVPAWLPGTWYVSLCIRRDHAWIRFQNTLTGEVHTLARFLRGYGTKTDPCTGRSMLPPVSVSGLIWDQDLRYEPEVAAGRHLLLTVTCTDPVVYTGTGCYGYRFFGDNCVTYARDAWHFYSGEWYALPGLDLPGRLAARVGWRHPDIPIFDRLRRRAP